MTPSELEKWLETDEAKDSGQGSDDRKSIGFKSGKKNNKDLTYKKGRSSRGGL